jgi:D-alanine-D-alanine ligase
MTSSFSLSGKSVAVLMGGPGAEREVSLRSGDAVCRALTSLGAVVTQIDVTERSATVPEGIDLAFNMIHGTFGEDGELQAILDEAGVPYTGEGAAGSKLAFDKIESKKCFEAAGVPTARWEIIERGSRPSLPLPYVAKPPREGSSVGVHILKSESEVDAALADCFARDHEVLIEEFIEGAELTVGIVGDLALPIVEIVPKLDFYTYENKYTKGASDYFCPARLDEAATAQVQAAALAAYRSLKLEVYARVDVLLERSGRPYVLEVNTIPGMTETSLLPKAAAAIGIDFPELCSRIANLSLAKRLTNP